MAIRGWLFGLEAVGIKLGLEQMRAVLSRLSHPEATFTAITVAGTNGKGSVSAMIERGLRAAGTRTGRYTSPHLIDIEERIVIDGVPISADAFDRAAVRVRAVAETLPHPPSFFEAVTAIACEAFREAGVALAVMEVGLGGRLDATNAIDAPVAVITHIGLDHQLFLGDTIEAIAAEKAGVIKSGASVIVAPTPDAARTVIEQVATRMSASIIHAEAPSRASAHVGARYTDISLAALSLPGDPDGGGSEPSSWRLSLPGRHQVQNAVTAMATLTEIGRLGLASIDRRGLRLAIEDVRWPGRLDWRRYRERDVLVDGAHNPDGARALADFLHETGLAPMPLVFGMMRDKHVDDVIAVLAPVVSTFVVTAAHTPRAMPAPELAARVAAIASGHSPLIASAPIEALERALDCGGPVLVAGSLFLAGDVLARCA